MVVAMAGAGREETMAQVPLDLHTLCCPEPKSSFAVQSSVCLSSLSLPSWVCGGRAEGVEDRGVNQGRGWWGKGVEDGGGGGAGGARMSGMTRCRVGVEKGAG
jgi:hypothetical protein